MKVSIFLRCQFSLGDLQIQYNSHENPYGLFCKITKDDFKIFKEIQYLDETKEF